jgi:uncharacterized protein YggU (UPF0235/DUF167 family)
VGIHRFAVRVKPGVSKPAVSGSYGDPPALIVAVHAQPVDGQANDAVLSALAKALNLKSRQVSVVSGHTARTKIVAAEVPDADDARLRARIGELLA